MSCVESFYGFFFFLVVCLLFQTSLHLFQWFRRMLQLCFCVELQRCLWTMKLSISMWVIMTN